MTTTTKTCRFTDCGRKIQARELCMTHYKQQHSGKELTAIGVNQQRLPIIDGQRICTRCKTLKPLNEFYKRTNGKSQSICKVCMIKAACKRHADQVAAKAAQGS